MKTEVKANDTIKKSSKPIQTIKSENKKTNEEGKKIMKKKKMNSYPAHSKQSSNLSTSI